MIYEIAEKIVQFKKIKFKEKRMNVEELKVEELKDVIIEQIIKIRKLENALKHSEDMQIIWFQECEKLKGVQK